MQSGFTACEIIKQYILAFCAQKVEGAGVYDIKSDFTEHN